jgi:hypothetical protein
MRRAIQSAFFLILNVSVLTAMLVGCAPAASVPAATAVPPTAVSTLAPTPTLTAEPSATPEPTKIPIPEGWAKIAETKEIGGRQIVFSDKGEAATEIEGVFYPVDAKGCFYAEFYDPEIQKQDPKIMELVEKLSVEPSFIYPDLSNREEGFWPRHASGSKPGILDKSDRITKYFDMETEGILSDQQLCYNEQSGKWEHVLTFVLVRAEKMAPNDSLVSRGVVGWLNDDKYESFTYRDEANTYEKTTPLVTGPGIKANALKEGFGLWNKLIEEKKQIGIRIPYFLVNGTNLSFEEVVSKLVQVLPETTPSWFSTNVQDPIFVEWLLDGNNTVKYFSDKVNDKNLFGAHRTEIWRYWGEQLAVGKMPEPVIRTVTEAKR